MLQIDQTLITPGGTFSTALSGSRVTHALSYQKPVSRQYMVNQGPQRLKYNINILEIEHVDIVLDSLSSARATSAHIVPGGAAWPAKVRLNQDKSAGQYIQYAKLGLMMTHWHERHKLDGSTDPLGCLTSSTTLM